MQIIQSTVINNSIEKGYFNLILMKYFLMKNLAYNYNRDRNVTQSLSYYIEIPRY